MRHIYQKFVLGLLALCTSILALAQVSVTATTGTTGPTAYTTLKAAFDAVNAGTHRGSVTVSITGNTTETAAAKLNSSGTGSASYSSLVVKPATGVSATISSASAVAGIWINGADNVTIDGSNTAGGTTRNLTITNTTLDTIPIIWITNSGVTNAATNNTVKNCIIKGATRMGTLVGILTGTDTDYIDFPALPNSNTTITNNAISKVMYGVLLLGSFTNYDMNDVVSLNDIGSPTASDKIGYVGIALAYQKDFTITQNNIVGINSPDESTASGIALYIESQNGTITKNKIRDIKNTEPTGYGANGIEVSTATLSSNLRIANNFISDITGMGWANISEYDNGYGIVITDGSGYNIHHNTILMNTSQSSASGVPAAFNVTNGVTATGAINLRNNIFANTQATGSDRYAIISSASSNVFASIDYNDYFSSGTALGYINGVDRITIADIQAGFGGNANSVSVLPVFVSATDLHLVPASNAGLNDKGITIAGVTDDIDGDTRSVTPDLGADEMPAGADANGPMITYAPLSFTCGGTDRTVTANIIDATGVPTSGALVPRIYYRKGTTGTWYSKPGTLTGGSTTNGTWTFTIVSADMGTLAAGDIIQYYIIAQDAVATPNIRSNPAGAVASNVNTVTTHPSAPATYNVSSTLSGTFTVGTGGNYATLSAAIAAYNNSCISGPVVFSLISAAYNETGNMVIEKNPYASATNTLTIRPAAGVNATVTTGISNMLTIRSSYVTIDGSNSGGTTRNLTLTSSNTDAIAIVMVQSVDTTSGVNYVTIRNTNVAGTGNETSLVGMFVSDSANFGLGIEGILSNITLQNNAVSKVYFGIVVGARTTPTNGNNVLVNGNTLNATGANAIHNTGIFVSGLTNSQVNNNTIGNFESLSDETDMGIFLGDLKNTTVNGNTITNLVFNGPDSIGAAPTGIYSYNEVVGAGVTVSGNTISNISTTGEGTSSGMTFTGAATNFTIEKNKINNIKNTQTIGWGANGINLDADASANYTIANNFIWDVAGMGYPGTSAEDNGYGLVISGGSGYNIYHNTIWMNTNQANANGISSALMVDGTSGPAAINLKNNILANSQSTGDNRFALYSAMPAAAFASIDNNVYYSTDSAGFVGGLSRLTLAQFQAGFGGNLASVITQPFFAGPNDLHLASGNTAIDNKGTPVGILTDIDNDVRSTTTPDPGADEFAAVCVAPVIGTQPVAQASCVNGSATFNVTLSSGSSATYQWRRNSVNIAGATNSFYTINGVTAANAGNYDVVITNACGNVTSAAVALTVNPSPVPDFTVPAANCANTPVTFTNTSTVAGGGAITYAWRFGNNTSSTAANGTATYATSGMYTVTLVANSNGCLDSVSKAVMVGTAPMIITQPVSQNGCPGTTATFSVQDSGVVSRQWYKNAAIIPGATAATLTLTNISAADAATYYVRVTNGCGSVNSNNVTLSVSATPGITTQPVSATGCAGTAITLSVTASNGGATYQWRKNNVNIAGATSATYVINNATSADAGNYDVVVGSSCGTGSVTSSQAIVTVTPKPAITTQPVTQTVCAGANASFSVIASGTNLSYQWRRNGSNINGATNSSYTIFNVAAANAGTYTVKVTGTCGSDSSANAVLTVSTTGSCATALPRVDADVTGAVLMPNLVRDQTVLRVQMRRAMQINWVITDATGRVVKTFTRQLTAGRNDLRIDLADLSSGTYQVTGTTGSGRTSVLRFVKQ